MLLQDYTFPLSNPIFDKDFWKPTLASPTSLSLVLPPMTLAGTIDKSFILMGSMLPGAVIGYFFCYSWVLYISLIIAAIVVGMSLFYQKHIAVLALIYAALNGVILGGALSSLLGGLSPVLTIMGAYLFLVICLYFKLVDVTHQGKLWATAFCGSVFFNYVANLILYLTGHEFCFLHQYDIVSITLLAILWTWMNYHQVYAVRKLMFIETLQLPNDMEWLGALGWLAAVAWAFAFVVRFIIFLVEIFLESLF